MFPQLTVIPHDGEQPEVDVCDMHIKVERIEDRRRRVGVNIVETKGRI